MRLALGSQPGTPAIGQTLEGTRDRAGNAGFLRIRFRLQTPDSPILGAEWPKVSSHLREYSRFVETVGGDLVRWRPRSQGEGMVRSHSRDYAAVDVHYRTRHVASAFSTARR